MRKIIVADLLVLQIHRHIDLLKLVKFPHADGILPDREFPETTSVSVDGKKGLCEHPNELLDTPLPTPLRLTETEKSKLWWQHSA